MERWRSFLLLFLAVVVIGAFIWHTWTEHEKKKREAAYQRILQGYSEALKPGMTRKGVEDYLLDTGAKFTHICCIDERSTFADITKVGEEHAPWFCSEYIVYIAFQFVAYPARSGLTTALPSDKLKKITLFPHLEGCL